MLNLLAIDGGINISLEMVPLTLTFHKLIPGIPCDPSLPCFPVRPRGPVKPSFSSKAGIAISELNADTSALKRKSIISTFSNTILNIIDIHLCKH